MTARSNTGTLTNGASACAGQLWQLFEKNTATSLTRHGCAHPQRVRLCQSTRSNHDIACEPDPGPAGRLCPGGRHMAGAHAAHVRVQSHVAEQAALLAPDVSLFRIEPDACLASARADGSGAAHDSDRRRRLFGRGLLCRAARHALSFVCREVGHDMASHEVCILRTAFRQPMCDIQLLRATKNHPFTHHACRVLKHCLVRDTAAQAAGYGRLLRPAHTPSSSTGHDAAARAQPRTCSACAAKVAAARAAGEPRSLELSATLNSGPPAAAPPASDSSSAPRGLGLTPGPGVPGLGLRLAAARSSAPEARRRRRPTPSAARPRSDSRAASSRGERGGDGGGVRGERGDGGGACSAAAVLRRARRARVWGEAGPGAAHSLLSREQAHLQRPSHVPTHAISMTHAAGMQTQAQQRCAEKWGHMRPGGHVARQASGRRGRRAAAAAAQAAHGLRRAGGRRGRRRRGRRGRHGARARSGRGAGRRRVRGRGGRQVVQRAAARRGVEAEAARGAGRADGAPRAPVLRGRPGGMGSCVQLAKAWAAMPGLAGRRRPAGVGGRPAGCQVLLCRDVCRGLSMEACTAAVAGT